MKFYGQLEGAAFEVLAADPSASTQGRVWLNSTSTKLMLDDGTLKRALLRNDQNMVLGNNATPANNVRLNRAANAVLQLVPGGDTTAEGSLATSLAQLSARQENYTTVGRPAAGQAGRLYFDTTTNLMYVDNGTAWVPVGTGGGFYCYGSTTVASAGTITISTAIDKPRQKYEVIGALGTPQVMATAPFGNAGGWADGTEVLLIGQDNAATVTLNMSDTAYGVVGNFDSVELGQYAVLHLVWSALFTRWVIKSR